MKYDDINRLFTLACFSMPPIVGSATSVVWHGGAMLLMLAAVYAGGGSVNVMFGRDILDTVFMVFLIVGLFLARRDAWF